MDLSGDADSAGLGQLLDPCGDVHAVAVDVRPFADDVAEVDADAKIDPLRCCATLVRLRHPALKFQHARHRIDSAGEFHQPSVSHRLDDAPAMSADDGLHDRPEAFEQYRERPGLVGFHETRISGDIGHGDGGQATIGAFPGHAVPESGC